MQVEHLAVELGVGAVHFELDVLAEFGGEIAHDARQLLPSVADRLHARLHHAFLQLGGDIGQPLQRHLELGIVVPAHDVEQLIAGQHQLGHHGHQMLEGVDVDADRCAWRSCCRSCPRRRPPAFELADRRRVAGREPASARRTRRFAEGAFELVERDLARAQRRSNFLRHSRGCNWRAARPAPCTLLRHLLELNGSGRCRPLPARAGSFRALQNSLMRSMAKARA